MKRMFRYPAAAFCLSVLLLPALPAALSQPAQLSGGVFIRDRMLPEMLTYTMGGWRLRVEMGFARPDGSDLPHGAVVRFFVRNTSAQPLEVTGVWLEGVDLAKQIVPKHKEHGGTPSAGYLLNSEEDTPPDVRARLDSLGRPVWYQVRPDPVPPGAVAEVNIRLQAQPQQNRLRVRLSGEGWTTAELTVRTADDPVLRLAGVNFSPDIRRLYLYLRRLDGQEFRIRQVRLDGRTLPLPASVPGSSKGFLPLALDLPAPLEFGSFHFFEVTDSTGQTARNVVRARDDYFALGMWGYRNDGNTVAERARDTCRAFRDHLFNTHMLMAGEQSGYLVGSDEGFALLQEMGLRVMSRDPTRQDIRSPWTYARFVMDEPDAHDYFASDLQPADLRLGSMGQGVVARQRNWTLRDHRTLCLLNIDNTYVPFNYLTYGSIPDILALDPYYIENLRGVYEKNPERISQFFTPMYVMGTAEYARLAAEPRPTHVILNSTSYRFPDQEPFRFPTPEEKRVEFYMALGTGTKGISYWWFTPIGECYGCGSREPEAQALMRELARLNAEARTLLPELGVACAAAQPGSLRDPFASMRPFWVIARTLFAGPDTAIVTLFNRNHSSDRHGTIFQPVEKATMTFTPPSWLDVKSAFRVDGGKLTPLDVKREGDSLTLELGRLDLGDMVVLTSDPSLHGKARERWAALEPMLKSVLAEQQK